MADTLTLRNHDVEARIFTGRVMILWLVLGLAMFVLVLRLYQLQVLEYARHVARSEQNRIEVQPLAPTRGQVFDRHGRLIAGNLPVFSLTVVRERVEDLDATLALLAELVGLTPEEIETFRKRARERRRPFEPVPLRLRLEEDEIARVAVNRHRLPGVEVEAQMIRFYPQGELLAHALGSVRRITPEDLQRLDPVEYSATRFIGRLGVEKYYEAALHGHVGHERVETDARGRIMRVLDRTPPVSGSNVTLHLDLDLQRAAVAALDGRRGAIVAIEPESGGILAMVSNPGYDPNLFIGGIDTETYAGLRDDPDMPLFNRALRGQYAPGSTFKPFVALAALANGETDWSRTINDPGYYQLPNDSRRYRDWSWRPGGGGQGIVHLRKAIYRSSNTYFFDLATRLGVDRIVEFTRPFGFGDHLEIDVPDAANGLMPDRQWKRRVRGEPWYPGDNLNLGIGQGDMLVTPLQLATAVSILANRGARVRPRMILASDAPLPELETAPLPPIELAEPANFELMVDAMEDVVHRGNQVYGENGTAWAYVGRDIAYRMAGKSGTAQVVEIPQGVKLDPEEVEERRREHAWFVAFAPADAPKIAVAVLVENGGGGSSTAAPVAKSVLDAWLLPGIDEDAQQLVTN
ncbi:MAG: penicillin-binding protein 2 [Pseudomonadales bacterium]|jgi:penicillin-binding protein 2|nr:penicillin-binding protein 2 [Pseudomonadales bacterium]